ncbi:protein farnesyltransferase [Paramyrothecium foliicola]|nr:protein farnesyltransferase [Paramyrothecium foliicola]
MPPKPKGGAKVIPIPETKPTAAQDPEPETVADRSKLRYYQTNPLEKRREEVGIRGLTPAEKKTYIHTQLIVPVASHKVPLANKTEREYWKQVAKEGLPIRRLRKDYDWGNDRSGRPLDTYRLDEFQQRSLKQARLTALDVHHRQFLVKRELARQQGQDLAADDVQEEKQRRKKMAELSRELYGEITGSLAQDPAWDDVVPIPQNEPEDALAKIAYPDDYAEAVSYLRAVMFADELSLRALRLTEHVISMNPAHYTVWLFRFKIVAALGLPVPDEIRWLNDVALANLKNYQIWHHRQLLLDHHHPAVAGDEDAVKALARSETDFLRAILERDTKNYHVWSYRHYLVAKLGLFNINELLATQNLIEDDLRNNSAWSHRYFLVFDDPKLRDGADPSKVVIPADVLDREVNYAKEKIRLAPQNQSSWNYLRGALTKAGQPSSSLREFAEQFVKELGADGEEVHSSHALDVLAEVYADAGEVDRARLCLRRLAEKWDPVREGYWKYRTAQLGQR